MLAAAEGAGLGEFISLCVKTKEWDRLARRVHSAKPSELEALSHYCTEPAAKGLAKRDAMAAAKLYRTLGSRILNAGKSKYYDAALAHFKQARNLYHAAGQNSQLGQSWSMPCGPPTRASRAFCWPSSRSSPASLRSFPFVCRTRTGAMETADFIIAAGTMLDMCL